MDLYYDFSNWAEKTEIKKGDIVLLSSDMRKIMWRAFNDKKTIDVNGLIDSYIEAIGHEGTLLIPTFYWGFFEGKPFDYRYSSCDTGVVGTTALKRDDFSRTKHPIYSFAVFGKYQDYLVSLEDDDCYGEGSVFAFLKEKGSTELFIDVSFGNSFTFVHYVEQMTGCSYRGMKTFSGDYIDANGVRSRKDITKLVPDRDKNVRVTIDPIEDDLIYSQAEKKFNIDGVEIKRVDLIKAYEVIYDDIVNNRSRKICNYIGQ